MWGPRLYIHEWTLGGLVCIAVQHIGDEWRAFNYPIEITPERGVLDPRCYEVRPKQVTAFKVLGNLLTGSVRFPVGYNLSFKNLSVNERRGYRRISKVQVNIVPGSGKGRFDFCPDEDPNAPKEIRSLGGAKPDGFGNISMSVSSCFFTKRSGVRVDTGSSARLVLENPHAMAFDNNCLPCCTCNQQLLTYNDCVRAWQANKILGKKAMRVWRIYKDMRTRWLEQKACREASPARLYGMPTSGGLYSVVASVCNAFQACRGPLRMDIHFDTSGPVGEVVDDTTLRYGASNTGLPEVYTLLGSWPDYAAEWDQVDPARSVRVKFLMEFAPVSNGDFVTTTVTPSIEGVPLGPPVTTTNGLRP
jgi:hypothetical protein